MNELIKFLTSTEVLIVYAVAGALIALCLIIYAIDRGKEKRKKRHNTNELNKLVEEVQVKIEEEKKEEKLPKVTVKETTVEPQYMHEIIPTPTSNVKEMTYNELKEDVEELKYYDSNEPNKEEALSELARITKELEEQANEERLQSEISKYEDEREQEAIISYDELLQRTNRVETTDEMNTPISMNEINIKETDPVKSELTDAIAKATGEEPVILSNIEATDISNIKEDVSIASTLNETKKFQRSPIISPIYGIEKNYNIENQMEFENTANYEKLDAEIKKTNEFLSTIKELQKKL